MASTAAAPTCSHVKTNGKFCGSLALANDPYCYYHHAARERTKRQLRHARQQKPLQLPLLEDRESIQTAIGDVLNAILADRIDARKAGLLLYGLQTAAANVADCDFELSEYEEQLEAYTEIEERSLQDEIEEEIAEEAAAAQPEVTPTADPQPAPKPAPAQPSRSADTESTLPKKKPATRVSNKQLWDVVGAVARQNAHAAANKVRKQIEKNA